MDTADLTAAVESLTGSVGELAARSKTQQLVIDELKRQRKDLHSTKIVLAAAIAGIVLDLGLTIGGVLLYRQVDTNQHQIQQVQERTSAEILCPLFIVFATSIKVNPPSPNLTPEQAKVRQDAADTILSGLSKLGCA